MTILSLHTPIHKENRSTRGMEGGFLHILYVSAACICL